MNRRNFLISAGTTTGVIAVTGGVWLNLPATDELLTMDAVAERLNGFRGKALVSSGKWSPAHVFKHNAQSIDYSMAGFPESKSALFQSLLGKPTFAVFAAKRAMHHGLAEAIPGAYEISDTGNLDAAIDKFLASINAFKAFEGPLKPHFAYGALSKTDYALAHVMHFYNHLSEIRLA